MELNPIPEDEKERLAALHGIRPEDLQTTEFANRLVQLAARHFDVMDSYIGIIDWDQEHFLACAGSDLDPLPREDTLCAYTVTQHDVLVIENVMDDDRFKDSETIQEFGIDWYASAPIVVDGENIGTFCLIDEEQQSLTDEDRKHLKMFAEEAADQIRLRGMCYNSLHEHFSQRVLDLLGL